MRLFFSLFIACFWLFSNGLFGQIPTKYSGRILLIPLDDRPPCLQFPVRMGMIADLEIVHPPKQLLGKFTEAGKPKEIIQWLNEQDLSKFDALIVSIDMLAYGGLVASRVGDMGINQARENIEILREIRRKAPNLPIYGSSVLMRLAPTADGKNEAWREKLNAWASSAMDPKSKLKREKLEAEIPKEVLKGYLQTRIRNQGINGLALQLVEEKVLNFLLFSQDDASAHGLNIVEKDSLQKLIERKKSGNSIAIQAGSDEVSMLLLARHLAEKEKVQPRVCLKFSSPKVGETTMPFEDQPLRKTLEAHIKAVGAKQVNIDTAADLVMFVFAERQILGRAFAFGKEIRKFADKYPQKKLVFVDIDPKGDIQGGDYAFGKELLDLVNFANCAGYASWNTAANAIGTALAQAVVFYIADVNPKATLQKQSIKKNAQSWFTMHRFVDDFLFHTLVRPKLLEKINSNSWNTMRLTEKQTEQLEFEGKELLQVAVDETLNRKTPKGLRKISTSSLTFHLPWNRTFEAEIDFQFGK